MLSVKGLGVFSASLTLIFPHLDTLVRVTPILTNLLYALNFTAILTSIIIIYYQIKMRREDVVNLAPRNRERAFHYLRGRGLGELQAEVVLDLAEGRSGQEIARSRFTTILTISSYRKRAYSLLGVHSIAELRELLSREAGMTTFAKMPPVK